MKPRQAGFSLAELLVALTLASLLTLGAVQLAQAVGNGYRLQQNLAALQENARFALQMMAREAEPAGYRHRPWRADLDIPALAAGTADNSSAAGDVVGFQRWSQRNCHDNQNPVTDVLGRPRYYLRVTGFRVSASGNLALTCRYGPDAGALVTQLNGLGLVEGVDSLQALYAEDTDGDGSADRWVRAGGWAAESGILGVRVGLLLGSPHGMAEASPHTSAVLDEIVRVSADRKLHRLFTAAWAIRGRTG